MITVNGEAVPFEGTVAALLEQRLAESRPHGVAIAVNEEVVPRGSWQRRRLADGDAVEIVTAVQGG
jgi:sulfur carrier protein